jgi:hypothetical protein
MTVGATDRRPYTPIETSADCEWYCQVFGTEFGPLPADALRRMVETEQLAAVDLVRSGPNSSWQALREIPEFRALLKGPDPQGKSLAAASLPPKPVQRPDEWYYQVDGKNHGPLMRAALEELIGSSGDTAEDVIVRHGDDGAWVPFFSLPGAFQSRGPVIRHDSIERKCTPAPIVSPAGARAPGHILRQFIRDNCDLVVAVAFWLFINCAILVACSQSYSTERKYFATLRSLEMETKVLQARHASSEEWAALRAHVKQTLAPIVQDLKKRASATEPMRQHLLWAARDHFPKCVGPQTREMEELVRLYERHIQVVDEELAKQ